jgi:radical SAM superfamily enzyme YgiQ (UPF0313 family)
MKLLLINPLEQQVLPSNLPAAIEAMRGKNPPIGLLYVAAIARQAPGWQTELLDAHAEDLTPADIAREVAARRPDVVGVTATTFTYRDALAAARAAKTAHPPCRVVFGGTQPFTFPAETLAQPEVDALVVGEAERALPALLDAWRDGGSAALRGARLPGVLLKGDDPAQLVPAPPLENLDDAPPPAWDLAPLARYESLITPRRPATIALTSRGCPFHCRYCALSPTGKKWRGHSPERVAEEMRICRRLGVQYVLFYDELLTTRRERVFAIAEALRRDGAPLPWMARATPGAGAGDFEMFAAMKSAGCDLITFGVEAGSPEVLQRLGRAPSLAQTRQAFADARRARLRTIAYFMIGNPGETRADVDASLRLAIELRPTMIHASLFVPYPGAAIYEEAVQEGTSADYWRDFARRPDRDFRPPIGDGRFSTAELTDLLLGFYRRFSFRPRYLAQRLREIRSFDDLRRNFAALRTLLRGFVASPPRTHP